MALPFHPVFYLANSKQANMLMPQLWSDSILGLSRWYLNEAFKTNKMLKHPAQNVKANFGW